MVGKPSRWRSSWLYRICQGKYWDVKRCNPSSLEMCLQTQHIYRSVLWPSFPWVWVWPTQAVAEMIELVLPLPPLITFIRIQVPSNPKWATFQDFCFPKRYVKSNKNALCNHYLHQKMVTHNALAVIVREFLRGVVPAAYLLACNRKVAYLNWSYPTKKYYYLCS